ncbi:hypothetical protein [Echinicola shivajiensis]|uniref:hypothetical protein n=1 Tax=Echinicola shivajiensis TaxID=1035916 RepID=UPI001BFC1C41|nr:hypothetical protein [Echinicola shivajiensis]
MKNYRIGFLFAIPIVIVGIILTLAGSVAAFKTPISGISLVLVGSFFWSSHYGVQINKSRNLIREYGSFLGIKSGKWTSMDALPFIAVLNGKSSMIYRSRSNRSYTNESYHYEICMFSKTPRKSITIKKFKNKEKAIAFSETLANQFKKELISNRNIVAE